MECGALEAWTAEFGSPGDDTLHGVAVDASGFTFVVGAVGVDEVIPGQLSAGGADGLVSKVDGFGRPVWHVQFGTEKDDRASAVAVDADGNAYVVGTVNGALFDTLFEVNPRGGDDAFVFLLDPAGSVVWSTQVGTLAADVGLGVALGPDDALYVVGATEGSLGGRNAGGAEAFVQRLDARSGEAEWVYQVVSPSVSAFHAVSVSPSGEVFCAGAAQATAGDEFDGFLVALSPSGDVLWRDTFGVEGDDTLRAIVATADAVFVAGETAGTLPDATLEGIEVTPGDVSAFVARYTLEGEREWVTQYSAADGAAAYGIVWFDDTLVVVGATPPWSETPAVANAQAFVAELDASGALARVQEIGGAGHLWGRAVAVFRASGVVLGSAVDAGAGADFALEYLEL